MCPSPPPPPIPVCCAVGYSLFGKWESLFTCPYTFVFWTRLLTGTASSMASESVLFELKHYLYIYISVLKQKQTLTLSTMESVLVLWNLVKLL